MIRNYWRDLPDHIKEEIVSKLDYMARCRLRKCSRSDRDIVDNVPQHFEDLTLQIDEQSVQIKFSSFAVSYRDVYGCNIVRILSSCHDFIRRVELVNAAARKSHGMDLAIRDFQIVLKNSKIDRFHLKCSMCFISKERKRIFLQSLCEQLRLNDLKIATRLFHCDFSMRNEEFTQLMRRFDSKTLTELFLGDNFLDGNCRIYAKKQWRKLKKASVLLPNNIPIAHFLHIERFFTFTIKLTPQWAWMAIQSILAKNSVKAEFSIGSCEELDLQGILQKFNVPVKNEPLEMPWINGHILHTQKFSTFVENHRLVVLILSFRIAGRIFQISK